MSQDNHPREIGAFVNEATDGTHRLTIVVDYLHSADEAERLVGGLRKVVLAKVAEILGITIDDFVEKKEPL